MYLLSGAVEEFDGLSNLEEATQRYCIIYCKFVIFQYYAMGLNRFNQV